MRILMFMRNNEHRCIKHKSDKKIKKYIMHFSPFKLINIDDKWIKTVHRKTFKLVYWCWRRYNKWPTVLLINVSSLFFNRKAKRKSKTSFYSLLREMCCLQMFFSCKIVFTIGFFSFLPSSTSKVRRDAQWFIYDSQKLIWDNGSFSILLKKRKMTFEVPIYTTLLNFRLSLSELHAWKGIKKFHRSRPQDYLGLKSG